MKTRIVRIGNSRGIRIPKPLIEQSGLKDEVEIEVRDGAVVIYSAQPPRAGWDDAFRGMSERNDDGMLDGGASRPSRWDETEWEW